MVALVGFYNSTVRTISTPSGWTYIQGTSATVGMYAFWKTANSGDVSASDYTFSASGNTTKMAGVILRISGQAVGNEVVSEYDTDNVSSTTLTYTTALTPVSPESLLIMAVVGRGASNPTVSGYASTPSATWTERSDLSFEAGTIDFFFGVATAPYTGTTQLTAREFTLSASSNSDSQTSVIVAVNALQNASGTSALLSISPTFFSPAASAGTTGSSALHAASPTFPVPFARATTPPQWTNQTKGSAAWTNQTK